MMRLNISAILMITFVLISCKSDMPRTNVPDATVNFRLQLNSYDDILNNSFAYKIFTEESRRASTDRFGYSGLMVVTGRSVNEIYAYDLCCPYEGNRNVKLTPRTDGKAECKECGSLFITIYGNAIPGRGMVGLGVAEKGPASKARVALKSYTVVPLQQGEYRVIN